ncbi:MAG: lysylphosphatidylglycerol synthase domain-containing protein [Gemmatimonadales bacterium]
MVWRASTIPAAPRRLRGAAGGRDRANFVDVLLVQTLITFLLYFAPTPGASGIAEVLSAAVMSVYVPRGLVPLYTIIWRLILSWFTIAAGFTVFSLWVRRGLKAIEVESG